MNIKGTQTFFEMVCVPFVKRFRLRGVVQL